MLRANVGLSRKLSRDFNSSGFTVNLEGEISAAAQDNEAVLEQIKQLYDLAEEALDLQIQRSQGDSAVAERESQDLSRSATEPSAAKPSRTRTPVNGTAEERATEKQIDYLLSIGKRQRFNTLQLERRIGEVLEQEVGLYDLSKRQAAQAIDRLTGNLAANGRN
jgi:hypothetical protein